MPKLGMGPIRREQICRAAVVVIAREGYGGTTMRMVAEEAGVSTGMLNHYFANRQDLLIQALVYVSERSLVRYTAAIEGIDPGERRLEALLDSVLGEDEESEETWRVWINVQGEAVRLPELRRTIEERLAQWFVLIDRALEGLVAPAGEGQIPWSVFVDSILTGFVIMAMTSEAELARREIRDQVIAAVLARAQERRPPWAGTGPRPSDDLVSSAVRAVTFQAPGVVAVEDRPDPELIDAGDAIVRVEASGICGSDLHIYHGRVQIEAGFTIGHEYVGTVVAAGEAVTNVAVGDRVLGCFQVACGECFFCRRGLFQRCEHSRTFGHGATLGSLQGTQAELTLVPQANLVLRKVPAGMSDDTALFAGDVMGTGFHAVSAGGMRPGDVVAVLGLGPVGLCAVQVARASGAAHVIAIDTVPERLEIARRFGAQAVHLTEEDPKAAVKAVTEGRGVDLCVDAVGDPRALEMAIRLTRNLGAVQCIGVYAERAEVHMGLLWLKGITLRGGHANVIAHVDRVLAMMSAGVLDPTPLVTHHMRLEQAPEAYAVYDRREALKIVLTP